VKRSVIQQIKELPPAQQDLFPEIRVEPEIKVQVEPVFEVTTPAPDMTPFAEALKQLMIPQPNVDVQIDNRRNKRVQIDVERDGRGFIKSLICTELDE